MTALPSGAVTSAASAMGIMPAIMAALVIKIGRMRSFAALIPESRKRPRSAVLLRERHQQDGVRRSHAHRHDCSHVGLNVQRLRDKSIMITPQRVAGAVVRTTKERRTDSKLAASRRKMTPTIASSRPDSEACGGVAHGSNLPAHLNRHAAWQRARRADGRVDAIRNPSQVFSRYVGGKRQQPKPVARSYSPTTVPSVTRQVSNQRVLTTAQASPEYFEHLKRSDILAADTAPGPDRQLPVFGSAQ